MSIDLSGVDAGSISQTLATTIGNTYTVSFFLSGNPAGPPVVKTLDVSATGAVAASYTYDASANDLTNMNWTQETYTFLATNASTSLSFVSTTSGAFGPAIDNVVITETVPTKSDCKDGGWQAMIDTSGNHFKNQGDCVSFYATKGKNLGALPPVTAANSNATTTGDAVTSQVKHAKKEQHTNGKTGPTKKPSTHAGHGHAPRSHHTK